MYPFHLHRSAICGVYIIQPHLVMFKRQHFSSKRFLIHMQTVLSWCCLSVTLCLLNKQLHFCIPVEAGKGFQHWATAHNCTLKDFSSLNSKNILPLLHNDVPHQEFAGISKQKAVLSCNLFTNSNSRHCIHGKIRLPIGVIPISTHLQQVKWCTIE